MGEDDGWDVRDMVLLGGVEAAAAVDYAVLVLAACGELFEFHVGNPAEGLDALHDGDALGGVPGGDVDDGDGLEVRLGAREQGRFGGVVLLHVVLLAASYGAFPSPPLFPRLPSCRLGLPVRPLSSRDATSPRLALRLPGAAGHSGVLVGYLLVVAVLRALLAVRAVVRLAAASSPGASSSVVSLSARCRFYSATQR